MATNRKDAPARDDAPLPPRPLKALVIHGPNLNLLGTREPEIYGSTTLKDIDRELVRLGAELGITVTTYQSNSEGAIVDRIQKARGKCDVMLINPGAYTHTSVAIRDAIAAVALPTVMKCICPTCIGASRFGIIRRSPISRMAGSWALARELTWLLERRAISRGVAPMER